MDEGKDKKATANTPSMDVSLVPTERKSKKKKAEEQTAEKRPWQSGGTRRQPAPEVSYVKVMPPSTRHIRGHQASRRKVIAAGGLFTRISRNFRRNARA